MNEVTRRNAMRRDPFVGRVMLGRWMVTKKLSSGGFGVVYKAYDRFYRDRVVAIKMEPTRGQSSTLPNEYDFYENLGPHVPGFPRLYDYGRENDGEYRVLVMSLLGGSLYSAARRQNDRLSLKTVLCIGVQGLDLIRSLHERGYVHRDIKPENMMIGRKSLREIHLIDFGLVGRYQNGGRHILDDGERHGMVGTTHFASIRCHKGRRLTRRDDLESFAYTLLSLINGSLPWDRASDKDDVLRVKERYSPAQLCDGLPSCFLKLLNEARGLRFREKPDYSRVKNSFVSALHRRGWKVNSKLDWM